MAEDEIQQRIQKYLRSLGGKVIKIHGSRYQEAGTPDLLGSLKGRCLAIEVKRPGDGVVSTIQNVRLRQWRAAGAIAFVAYSVEDVEKVLRAERLL